jgi:hypothetical protein
MKEREKLVSRIASGLLAGGYCIDDPVHRAKDVASEAVCIADAILAELAKPQPIITLKEMQSEQYSCSEIPNSSAQPVSFTEEIITAIHDTLRLVWSRELSADDGLEEIEALLDMMPTGSTA